MNFINKLLDENYDWGDKRIDEDVYDELSAELIIDYLKKHDSEIRQMLALSWNFDNPKKVIQWIVEQPDTDKGTCLLLYWRMAPDFSKQFVNREECEILIVGILKIMTSSKQLNRITHQDFTGTNATLSILVMIRIKMDMTGLQV